VPVGGSHVREEQRQAHSDRIGRSKYSLPTLLLLLPPCVFGGWGGRHAGCVPRAAQSVERWQTVSRGSSISCSFHRSVHRYRSIPHETPLSRTPSCLFVLFCYFFFRSVKKKRDEVLDLKFSPDGTRLATCSRDMSILIYAIENMPPTRPRQHQKQQDAMMVTGREEEEVEGEEMLRPLGYKRLGVRLVHRLQRSATASVCRLFW